MLEELYQEIILEYASTAKRHGELSEGASHACSHNPLCGDKINLWLRIEDEFITDARFTASGCTISRAAAAIMSDIIVGKHVSAAEELTADFKAMLEGEADSACLERIGDLAALKGVQRFPTRIRCALLPFEALREIMAQPVKSQS